jgi:hypothetical protein
MAQSEVLANEPIYERINFLMIIIKILVFHHVKQLYTLLNGLNTLYLNLSGG